MIELAEKVSDAVNTWREGGYQGVSDVTRRLLDFWFREEHYFDDGREFAFWRCQREAIESLIYTYEVCGYDSLYSLSQGYNVSMSFDPTQDRWPRYCFRMATGSGKTFVMALSIVWQFFNKLYQEGSPRRYSENFLIISPNLVVLDRLRDFENAAIFREWPFFIPPEWEQDFDLQSVIQTEDVPIHSRGALHITNVQQFYERAEHESENPIQRLLGERPVSGEEFKNRATLYDILARYENLLVINDEAHHAHPATEWWEVMKRLNQRLPEEDARGLGMQLDFSATPMDATGNLFPHVFYDYPLAAAIEDEIVKRPHIGTIEGVPEPIGDDFVTQNQIQIDQGIALLERKKEELEGTDKKPVLFVMCDRVSNADKVGAYLENERGYNGKVLVIHTYERRTRTGFLAGDIKRDELSKVRRAAKEIDTNQYEIIVSVLMLKEGWDVKNVTTIVPLRAYESRILVEQTLGRGLRRMFPENKELVEKLVVVEHPRFKELWEAEIRDRDLQIEVGSLGSAYEPANRIAVDESKLEFDFDIPIVRGGITRVTPDLKALELDKLPSRVFSYDEIEVPSPRYIEKDLMTQKVTEETDIYFDYTARYDEYLSQMTKAILRRVGSRSQFSALVPILKWYIENALFDRQVNIRDPEVVKRLNHLHVRSRIKDAFVEELNRLATSESEYTVIASYRLSDTKPVHTSKPTFAARKTVFNALPYHHNSDYEREFMVYLDDQAEVLAFTKILSRFPLRIPYYDESGILHHYLPDFIVKTREGRFHLLETKGTGFAEMPSVIRKDRAARNWCENISEMAAQDWRYIKVTEDDFDSYKSFRFSEFVDLVDR